MTETKLLQQQREEATSPETTSARLTKLAKINDNEIKKAIASNPNTPPSILWQVGKNYPLEVLNNPIFALLPLENPRFIDDIPKDTLIEFLKQKECPHWLIEQAFKQKISGHITANILIYHQEFWHQLNGKYPKIKIDLEGNAAIKANLQGANLQGANLHFAHLQGANLQSADLQGANLQSADLQGAYLENANLQNAKLQCARLQRANLQGANLQDAYLQGAYLQGANLQGANLQGANLQGANLQDANLQDANVVNTLIESLIDEAVATETTEARLTELAKILYPEIQKAIASNPNTPLSTLLKVGLYCHKEVLNNPFFALLQLENPRFIDDIPEYTLSQFLRQKECPHWLIELAFKRQNKHHITEEILIYHQEFWHKLKEKYPEIKINLKDANLQGANLQNANLQSAYLKSANLQGANLQGANLQGAIKYANLQGANLENANLENANLQGANLQNANLQNANLQNANLQNANLQNADLRKANLTNTNLTNANIENTKK